MIGDPKGVKKRRLSCIILVQRANAWMVHANGNAFSFPLNARCVHRFERCAVAGEHEKRAL